MKSLSSIIAVAALACVAPSAMAAPESDAHAGHHAAASAVDGAYVDGEVKRVDKEAGTISMKHGPIANLDMPAMSMVFRAIDRAMLGRVKQGDKVRFKADNIEGALTVTELRLIR